MQLRLRTLVVVGATLLGIFLAIFLTVRFALLDQFDSLERRAAKTDAARLLTAANTGIRQLDRVTADWAPRDDLYRYMRTRDDTFVDVYLSEQALANMGANALLLFDTDRRLVYSAFMDLDLESRAKPTTGVVEAVTVAAPLFQPQDPRGSASGVLVLPSGAAYVAARSITSSDMYSPPAGTLVLVRLVDHAESERLQAATQLAVRTYPLDKTALPPDVIQAVAAMGTRTPYYVEALPEGPFGAYAMVDDVYGKPALVLRGELPRDIFTQGQGAVAILGGALLVIAAVAIVIVYLVLDRSVLSRLTRLTRQVENIGKHPDPAARVVLRGSDEIASLAVDINWMLSSIESGQLELMGARDVLEQRVVARTEELRVSEERYRMLVEQMADAVFSVDKDGVITFVNERAEDLIGRPADELIGSAFADLLTTSAVADVERHLADTSGEGAVWTVDAHVKMRGGDPVPVELRAAHLIDDGGEITGTQWVARDVAERVRYEAQLAHMASHDHLTGLHNRRFFETALELELAESRRSGASGAVLWLDIDDFKIVNDSLGHRVGDEVLVAVAEQLRREVRESNVLARLGGDEFAVLLPGATVEEAETAARRILAGVNARSYGPEDHAVRVSASMGVVVYPDHGTLVEDLLANADIAMYHAKESGRSRVHVHRLDSEWRSDLQARVTWNERIAAALEEERFAVYAQPVLDVGTGIVARYELLIRMVGPDGEIIAPAEFLPAAERLGLIRDIDRWMVSRAVELIAQHADRGLQVEVNLSGKAFGDPEFLPFVQRLLTEAGADPRRLGLEITETAAISDVARARTFISTLKELGCRFALDDFGSGFSSFYYLKHLPIDCLKVDGSFVRELAHSDQDRHLVRGMVEMCRGLEIAVAVEYVEDEATLGIVGDLGVDFAQGYHIGRPVPIADALAAAEGERV